MMTVSMCTISGCLVPNASLLSITHWCGKHAIITHIQNKTCLVKEDRGNIEVEVFYLRNSTMGKGIKCDANYFFQWLSHQTAKDVVTNLQVVYVYQYIPVNWAAYVEWKLDIWNIIFYQFRTTVGPQQVFFHTYPYRSFLVISYQQDTQNAQPGMTWQPGNRPVFAWL